MEVGGRWEDVESERQPPKQGAHSIGGVKAAKTHHGPQPLSITLGYKAYFTETLRFTKIKWMCYLACSSMTTFMMLGMAATKVRVLKPDQTPTSANPCIQ